MQNKKWNEQDVEVAIDYYNSGLANHYIAFILQRTKNAVVAKLGRVLGRRNRNYCSMYKDITGQVFGKLTVIKRDGYIKDKRAWLCRCNCGGVTKLPTAYITAGKTKSCGCLGKFKKGEASFNQLFGQYKKHAKQRNLDFGLSKKEFRILTKQVCFYCGIEPQGVFGTTKRNNGIYIYNDIDRVDNNKGYLKDNCVSCCKVCNYMKLKLSFNDFISHIKRIAANMQQQQKRTGGATK